MPLGGQVLRSFVLDLFYYFPSKIIGCFLVLKTCIDLYLILHLKLEFEFNYSLFSFCSSSTFCLLWVVIFAVETATILQIFCLYSVVGK